MHVAIGTTRQFCGGDVACREEPCPRALEAPVPGPRFQSLVFIRTYICEPLCGCACTGTFKCEPVSAAASELIEKRSWSLMGYIVGHTASGIIDENMIPWMVQSLGDPFRL